MLVAIGYHAGDLQQATRLAEWMKRLGPYPGHRLLVARDNSADLKPFEGIGFDSVQEIVITDDAWRKWPESCNNVFRKLAKHIQYTAPEPWLLLEPDAVPIRAGWLDAIHAEYMSARKHFMGDLVTGISDTPAHCSGVAVYPGRLTKFAGAAVIAMEIPWDIAGADQMVPLMHHTQLIKHNWRPPEFNSLEEMRAEIPPECVLYHKDKTGNLIRLLNGTDDAVTAPTPQATGWEDFPPGGLHASSDLREAMERGSERLLNSQPPPQMQPVVQIIDEGRFKHGLGETTTEAFKATWVQQVEPWASPLESEQEIKRLCAELRRFCVGPVRTGIVRRELAIAKVAPLAKKKRRRK